MTEKRIPVPEGFLRANLDPSDFKVITWGVKPINGEYLIRESLLTHYGIIVK